MKLTFVSNYINHHQIPVSNAFYKALGEDYTFIQTEKIEEMRLQMGWQDQSGKIPYLRIYADEPLYCSELILQSDIVIFGGTDEESYIERRLQERKLTIRYSERIYKMGQWKAISPRGLQKKFHDHIQYRKAPVYLLCAGGYVASDFQLIKAYPEKKIKWGYFPETKHYDVDNLMQKKREQWITSHKEIQILWAGRFIDWKHPEMAIRLASQLKEYQNISNEGVRFHLQMVGGGEMESQLREEIRLKHLEDVVTLSGYLTPEEVRNEMERSQIYLFTSDYQEGWGAVLNEAMNSGCAVVASHAIGAVPFLLQHQKNGLVFGSKKQKDLWEQVRWLIENPEKIEQLGREACQTILQIWNAECAAQRFLQLAQGLLAKESLDFPQEGPCSKAEVIAPYKMYSYLRKKEKEWNKN